jgi:hypothetical protein
MNITTIPNILIDGKNVYPYGVEFSEGGSEPSLITLKFVNEDGKYILPQNDSNKVVKIKIGNFRTIDAYVGETETTSQSEGGSISTIQYIDSSIILDKINIGLKGVHGPGFETSFFGVQSPNLVLVGSQVDPCEELEASPVDPCAPACEDKNSERDSFDCVKEKALKILQVDYSFEDLRGAVSGKIGFGSFPAAINLNYRASYTGTLREVLKNWCSDFGLDFYWDNNSIYFIDTSNGIQINDSVLSSGQNVISTSEKKSILNNVSKIKSVYFGAEGEIREYSCSANSSKRLTLSPITLYDLLADQNSGGGISPVDQYIRMSYDPQSKNSGTALANFYDAIILSYYSDSMRDLYFLYEKENLDSPEDVEQWIEDKKNPIEAMGGFRPLISIHKKSENLELKAAYNDLLTLLDQKDIGKFVQKGGYFIIAEYNQEKHKRYSNMEKSLAEKFLGKYWIRPFSNGTEYKFDAPDGNVKYYSGGSEIILPFINDLPTGIQKASDFLQDLIESSGGEPGNLEDFVSEGKFLLMEREAIWSPAKNSDTIASLLTTIEAFVWEKTNLKETDFSGKPLAISTGQDIFSPNISVFMAFPKPEKLDLQITKSSNQTQNNPIDAKNVRSGSRELSGATVNYGLNSSETTYFIVRANGATIQIHAPSQAGLEFGSSYDGYSIFADGSNSDNLFITVPKKEVVLGDVQPNTSLDVASQLEFKDATQNLVKFIQSSGLQSCQYDESKIRSLLLKFNSRQKTQPNIERIIKSYEISGIPNVKLSPADGLQTFSISIGDRGVRTSLTFSNLPKQNRSENIEEKRFEELASILGKAKEYYKKK